MEICQVEIIDKKFEVIYRTKDRFVVKYLDLVNDTESREFEEIKEFINNKKKKTYCFLFTTVCKTQFNEYFVQRFFIEEIDKSRAYNILVRKIKNLKKSTPCTYKIVNTSIHKLGDKIPFLDYSVEDLIKIPGFIL